MQWKGSVEQITGSCSELLLVTQGVGQKLLMAERIR